MEMTKRGTIISFFGSREKVGRSMVSLNIAADLVKKKNRVIYGNSFDSDKDLSFLFSPHVRQEQKSDFWFHPSKIDGLRVLGYSKDASKMSPDKIEDMLTEMPQTISRFGDYLIYNIKDPFGFPDRYVLLKTDIHVMVVRVETTSFSDIFQQLEKMVFLPVKPTRLCLIFNYTRDIDRAFESYLHIMKQAMELSINIKLFFLGIVPNDLLRISLSNQFKMPARYAFGDSSFKGAVSFIGDKLIQLASVINKPQKVEEETTVEESFEPVE